jgi:probable rRNA maturation factor
MIDINFSINPDLNITLDTDLFIKTCRITIQGFDPNRETDASLVITDDAQVRALNRQFREIDKETDVLSFPSDEIDLDTGRTYLGDIIISYPQAKLQAEQAGHPVEVELQLLTVHGLLHLLGYDHSNEEEKALMWAMQDGSLKKMGLVDVKILDGKD